MLRFVFASSAIACAPGFDEITSFRFASETERREKQMQTHVRDTIKLAQDLTGHVGIGVERGGWGAI
jgi:hypothetical protein